MRRIGLVVLYVLLCVGLVVPTGNLPSPVSAVVTGSVTVSPASQTVPLGGSFSVDIVVDPAGKGASGGEVDVQFDPTAMSATDIVAGSLLGPSPLPAGKLIDNSAGKVRLALARDGATTTPTDAGVFATITFTGKDKPGTFAIDITSPTGVADEAFNDILPLTLNDGSVTFPGPRGTIEVASPGVAAPYIITGAAAYSGTTTGTGTSISIDAPVGEYTIEWGDVMGCVTPANETKTLTSAGTITLIGDYPPAPGTIEVSSTPGGATFTITGPVGYGGTATDTPHAISTGAPPGDYTIAWGDVTGYTKPDNQTKTLAAAGKITFSGVYIVIPPQVGTIEVSSAPTGATYSITGPANYSGTATGTATAIATDAPVGDYGIVWGDMPGYSKPANEVLTLTAGGKITFVGVYTVNPPPPQVGTIQVASAPINGPYTITGPTPYSGTADATTTSIATDAPVGDYTIVWQDVAGYITPPDETLQLADGGTIIFVGMYSEPLPQVGTIEVSSRPAGATYTITGAAPYTGTAAGTPTSIATDAPVGDYTIVWWDVTGYNKPADETLHLADGGTITFNGVYFELPPQVGTIEVTSNLAAPFILTGPAMFNGTANWTQTTSHLGEYSIIWLHVDGYTTPSSGLPQELTVGGTITFDGIYEALPEPVGTVEITSNMGAPYTVTGPATYTGMGDWTYNDSPVGDYTVHWGDVVGYITPADETLTLAEGGTITFNGNYVPAGLWTNVFRDPKRGTVLFINTCTRTFCFTAPDGFTTGVQQANWMTYKKGRINFGWRSGKLRISGFAHEGVDYGQCWVTKSWRLKYRMIDPRGFEA